MGRSILITDNNCNQRAYTVPWTSDAEAFNMLIPDETINISSYEGAKWIEALGNNDDISAVYADIDLGEEEYEFMYSLPNLRNIYFYTAKNLRSIDFVRKMEGLNHLYIANSQVSDISPVAELITTQEEKWGHVEDIFASVTHSIECVAICKAKVSDLHPFAGIKAHIGELNFSYNQITDLEPLNRMNIYMFTVSHNNVGDIEGFMNSHKGTYMLNARWNCIKSIEFMRDKADTYMLGRIFLGHNEISDFTPLKEGYGFVACDVD